MSTRHYLRSLVAMAGGLSVAVAVGVAARQLVALLPQPAAPPTIEVPTTVTWTPPQWIRGVGPGGNSDSYGYGGVGGTVTPPTAAGPSDVSANWSGLAATGATERQISATWRAPAFTQPASEPRTALGEWVGLGGMGSHHLIQVGTVTEPGPNGQAETLAFWEVLPHPAVMSASVPTGASVTSQIVPVGTDRWRLELTIQGRRTPVVDEVVTLSPTQAAGVETSAEWITEAPTDREGIMHLAPVGQTTMTNLELNGSTLASVPSADLTPITMVDGIGNVIAQPTVSVTSDTLTVTTTAGAASLPESGTGIPSASSVGA